MKGSELLDKMELADPAYVEAADAAPRKARHKWVPWVAAAACLCAAAGLLLLPKEHPRPDVSLAASTTAQQPSTHPAAPSSAAPSTAEPTEETVSLHFNDVDPTSEVDAARRYIAGYFTRDLTQEELRDVLPLLSDAVRSGFAGFLPDGTLLDVGITVAAPAAAQPFSVLFSTEPILTCYEPEGEVSTVNGVDFTVYRCAAEPVRLEAYAVLGGYHVFLCCEDASGAEADFARLLGTLSRCAQDVSALSRLPSGPVPEYFDRTLTLSEARADALFGAYLPSEPPVGFAPESIRRYKDQKDDTLSALWCSGYDELRWKVYRLDDETQTRLTTAAQTETYDLSLYPIPRAESVPEALRAVVDCPVFPAQELSINVVMARAYRIEDAGDGDGWRMHFAVLYDNIVVEVTAKGVEPAWLCAQLTALSGK